MNEPLDPDFSFDPADIEIARRLRAASPEVGNADRVLSDLRPQLTRARRRRQAGAVAIGVASLALFVGVAFAATDGPNGAKVRVPPANRSTPVTTVVPTDATLVQPQPTDPGPSVTQPGPTTRTTPATTKPVTPTTVDDDHGGESEDSGSGSSDSEADSDSGKSGSDD